MRIVKLNQNNIVNPCPKCGNNIIFGVHSSQVAEDCCEVWVECDCGYDPTAENTLKRFEDVMGGTHNDNVLVALDCWNDAIDDEVVA